MLAVGTPYLGGLHMVLPALLTEVPGYPWEGATDHRWVLCHGRVLYLYRVGHHAGVPSYQPVQEFSLDESVLLILLPFLLFLHSGPLVPVLVLSM